jgi:sortase (surface protein transpeptidase)
VYRMMERKVLLPDVVGVTNVVEDECTITLRSCPVPDHTNRLVVQGELVEKLS